MMKAAIGKLKSSLRSAKLIHIWELCSSNGNAPLGKLTCVVHVRWVVKHITKHGSWEGNFIPYLLLCHHPKWRCLLCNCKPGNTWLNADNVQWSGHHIMTGTATNDDNLDAFVDKLPDSVNQNVRKEMNKHMMCATLQEYYIKKLTPVT